MGAIHSEPRRYSYFSSLNIPTEADQSIWTLQAVKINVLHLFANRAKFLISRDHVHYATINKEMLRGSFNDHP